MNTVTNYITVAKDVREVLFSIVSYDRSYDFLVTFLDLAFANIPKIIVYTNSGFPCISEYLCDNDKIDRVLFKREINGIRIRITEQPDGQRTISYIYKP